MRHDPTKLEQLFGIDHLETANVQMRQNPTKLRN